MKVKNKVINPYLKNINRIETVITYECTGKCRHCSQGDVRPRGVIDKEKVIKAIYDIVEMFDIDSIMTFGGEPLLYYDTVCDIHSCAEKLNIPKRQLITNGYFSKDENKINGVCEKIVKSGINDVLLSVDAFHAENIPTDIVMRFAEMLKKLSVPLRINPAWIIDKNYPCEYNEKTHRILKPFTDRDIQIHKGNIIFPKGNALKYLGKYFKDVDVIDPYEEDPENIYTVSFEPCGAVLNGNIYSQDIKEILSSYDPSDTYAVKRIVQMEKYLDEVITAKTEGNINQKEIKEKISTLTDYMTSGKYLEDYERYEKGKIPKTIKCGILSQDTLYDLLKELEKNKKY